MSDKISLKEIIESVLEDNGIKYDKCNDSNVRRLRRAFDTLIERLGSDKEILKDSNGNFLFQETDIPFMKVIIGQLHDHRGLIAKFANERSKNKFSSKDVHELIQSIIDEEDKNGVSEDQLEQLAHFLSIIFLYAPLRSEEVCHDYIDVLAANLQDLPLSDQSIFMGKLEHILKKEFYLRLAESAQHSLAIALELQFAGDDTRAGFYYETDPAIRWEYIQRDQLVLERIQEDDDLRLYIEKKIGRKAEDIFNYASLADKSK